MTLRRLAAGAALSVLAAASASAVYAQETTSAVHGLVTVGGEPVANASVTLVHKPSGTRAVTSTEANGNFDLRGLRVGGPYSVTIAAPGKPQKVLDGVFLQVTKTTSLDIDLAEVEEIVVTGTVGRNNDQGPKTVLTDAQIASVVSVSRDPRDLARRDILVSQDLSGGRSGANAGGISIAGSNPRFNRIAVDGVAAQDNFGLAQGGLTTARGPVTLDAIEQFAIAAVPTDVENGDFSGGALNLVLKSGTNDYHGTVFVNYLNEGLVGTKFSGVKIKQVITQDNYGGFFSGPIIKDKLFFAVSYENYKTQDSTLFGAPGSGAPNTFVNLNQATIDSVINTFNSTYASKYTLGGVETTKPVTDKKYSAKLDWNINDQHRASVTYRYAKSTSIQRTDLGATTASLNSHWYQQLNKDTAVTAEVHSNWTDRLSTTLKATYRDYRNGQNPPGGQNFADITVCTAPTSDTTTTSCAQGFSAVRFGPDQFRHANSLDEQEMRLQALAEYSYNQHRFKVGVQARKADVFDVFVPQSHGVYYFDSLADFQAGKANRLQYQNAISGNPNDAAFDSTYWTYSAYAQDTVEITDDLTVAAGVRVETYNEPDRPTLNPNFKARNGFDNTKTIDKEWIVMPRVSVEWKPTSSIKISGGGGLFAGGTPDVLTGTPFYNNGYETSAIDIQRNAAGAFIEANNTGGFSQAIGGLALDNLRNSSSVFVTPDGQVVALQRGTVAGATGIPALAPVFALSPGFKMPGTWKAFLSGSWDLPDVWGVTNGVRVAADLVVTKQDNEISYYDSRAQPLIVNGVQQFLPDGRIRYDGLSSTAAIAGRSSSNLGGNNDLIVTNKDKGDAWTAGITVSKSFDWGLDASFGYARQNSDDLGPGLFFGTTAGSLYGSIPAFNDPNQDFKGRSVYEIKNRYKLSLSYAKAFFGDNETRITLFGEHQDGRPFGFTMQDRNSGRSAVFGVTKSAQALYVPNFAAGPSATNPLQYGFVTFATANDLNLFRKYVNDFNIPAGLVTKYTNTNAPINRVDLQLSQELPTLIEGHKLKVQFDIRNLLNLVNKDWGLVSEYSDTTRLVSVDCADANGVAVGNASATCVGYRYSNVPTTVTKTRNTGLSLWYMQVSLRYQF